MRTLYNLEYVLVDKLNRAKKKYHVGVYKTEEDVEKAKSNVLKTIEGDDNVAFNVYISENMFFN
jgi:hypothetical protein